MGAALRKVKPGDPLVLPAKTFNAFVDAAEDFQNRQQAQGRRPVAPVGRSSGVVVVKNSTGLAQGRFAVLGIDAPLILPSASTDEFRSRVAFSCVVPAADTHEGRFVILLEPLEAGAIGLAAAAGVVQVSLSVRDAAHAFAETAPGQTGHLLTAARGSAKILWQSGTSGAVDAIVALHAPPARAGQMTACRVWQDGPASGGDDGSLTTQCNRTYTVRTLDATAADSGGLLLGQGLTPAKRRPAVGKLSCPPADGEGVLGTGFFESDGTFTLYDANEVEAARACP